jgi:hypothetical protein
MRRPRAAAAAGRGRHPPAQRERALLVSARKTSRLASARARCRSMPRCASGSSCTSLRYAGLTSWLPFAVHASMTRKETRRMRYDMITSESRGKAVSAATNARWKSSTARAVHIRAMASMPAFCSCRSGATVAAAFDLVAAVLRASALAIIYACAKGTCPRQLRDSVAWQCVAAMERGACSE